MPRRQPLLGKPVALAPMSTSSAAPELPVLQGARLGRFRTCRVRKRATGCGRRVAGPWRLHRLDRIARTSTARVNSAAMAAATMVGANARSVPQFDARQAAAATQNAVDGNEGFFAAAATFFTGIFTYTTINGVRRVPAAAIVIGNRLNNRYNPVARGTRGGASTGGME